MAFSFSESKFLSLELTARHKKCCELLRAYVSSIHQKNAQGRLLEEMRQEYTKWCSWMDIQALQSHEWAFTYLEERFHLHVRMSGRGVHEADFLHIVHTEDKGEPKAPFLQVTTYLDGIRSAHNIGSILRTVEALRLGPVVFSKDMVSINHPQVQKTSMGTWSHVQVFQENNETHIDSLPLPRPWIAVETVEGAISWKDFSYTDEKYTLFLGNEERGLKETLLHACDVIIQIPLYGIKNSLNVANCHAIIAAEIADQMRRV